MPETTDAGGPVDTFSIPDRHFHHLEVELGSPENEIEVPK